MCNFKWYFRFENGKNVLKTVREYSGIAEVSLIFSFDIHHHVLKYPLRTLCILTNTLKIIGCNYTWYQVSNTPNASENCMLLCECWIHKNENDYDSGSLTGSWVSCCLQVSVYELVGKENLWCNVSHFG